MNKENILKVADAIEKQSIPWLGFDIREWMADAVNLPSLKYDRGCNTVACIGGWTDAVRFAANSDTDIPECEESETAAFLGIDDEQADELFYPYVDGKSWSEISPSQAARVLRHLAETGEVDWSVRGAP